eukprot:scaffold7091_cov273-Chaetoceros_neogracile.AAC.18
MDNRQWLYKSVSSEQERRDTSKILFSKRREKTKARGSYLASERETINFRNHHNLPSYRGYWQQMNEWPTMYLVLFLTLSLEYYVPTTIID